jgi:hypothetical protein
MKSVIVGLAILTVLLAFHFAMVALERRGLVHWTSKRRPSGGATAALGVMFDVVQPARQITVAEQEGQKLRRPVLPDDRPSD